MRGMSGPSATGMRFHEPRVSLSRRSGVEYKRGNSRSASRAHDEANALARSASSANRSTARSRIRRGSISNIFDPLGKTSLSRVGLCVSHGNQLSMPSKSKPSLSRSQCSRPQGSEATKELARARTASFKMSSRAGKIVNSSRSSSLRWSCTEKVVRRSTSSPQRSIRIGASAVDGKMSTIAPRRATSPRCSTSSSRR